MHVGLLAHVPGHHPAVLDPVNVGFHHAAHRQGAQPGDGVDNGALPAPGIIGIKHPGALHRHHFHDQDPHGQFLVGKTAGMAVVKGPGGELGGDDLLVARLHLVPGHVEHGLELAGKAEEAILLERRTAHRHPGRAQVRQLLGDGLGELRRQRLCHDFCLDGLPRIPQAFQVADMRLGDGLPDELLQTPGFKKELLGIGAHPKGGGHREPQPGEFAQFLGLAAVKEALPHLGQGQGQGPRLQLGPD